jgi:hypothetical protein
MTRKTVLSAIVTLFVLQAGHASAKEGLFGVGARFEWNNYKTPVVVQQDPTNAGQSISRNVGLEPSWGPTIGGEFHVIPIDRLVISLGLDFGFFSHKVYPYTAEAADEYEIKATYLTFGFLLGVKFYIIEPKPQKATLYAHLGGGKFLTKLKNNDNNPPDANALDAELEAVGKLAAPAVIQLALGAEYFVSSAFSLGADILGIRMAFSSYDNTDKGPVASPYSGEQKMMSIAFYSGLTLNFGFEGGGGGGRKKNKEEDWGGEDWGGGAAGSGAAAPQGGAQAGGGAEAGWGTPGGGEAEGGGAANGGWGQPEQTPEGGGDEGWGQTPPQETAPPPADNSGGGGWEATPPPPPQSDDGGGGGGGGRPRPKKAAKPRAPSTPPPPPPGY